MIFGGYMSKFQYAWDRKRELVVYPGDVADLIETNGVKPELMCPDKECRQIKQETRLTAVCCERGKEFKQIPHFRTYPNHHHSPECFYETLGKDVDYILRHKKEFLKEFSDANNLLRDIPGVDTELLPDKLVEKYDPTSFKEAINQKTREYKSKGLSNEQARRKAICAIPNTTSRLDLIVDMAWLLQDKGGAELREKARLSLPNRPPTNYLQAFLMVSSLKSNYLTPYILCGEARIYKYEDYFLIEYQSELYDYTHEYPKLRAYTILRYNHYKSRLLNDLENYSKSGEKCSVYSFSTHDLKANACPIPDKNVCVVIEPKFRDAIVIRKRCLKRGENNTR